MSVITESDTVQDDQIYHDVDCCAYYENDPRVWKYRVWLDKESNTIVDPGIIEFSADPNTMFDEIEVGEVPGEVLSALHGRVEAAKEALCAI